MGLYYLGGAYAYTLLFVWTGTCTNEAQRCPLVPRSSHTFFSLTATMSQNSGRHDIPYCEDCDRLFAAFVDLQQVSVILAISWKSSDFPVCSQHARDKHHKKLTQAPTPQAQPPAQPSQARVQNDPVLRVRTIFLFRQRPSDKLELAHYFLIRGNKMRTLSLSLHILNRIAAGLVFSCLLRLGRADLKTAQDCAS